MRREMVGRRGAKLEQLLGAQPTHLVARVEKSMIKQRGKQLSGKSGKKASVGHGKKND